MNNSSNNLNEIKRLAGVDAINEEKKEHEVGSFSLNDLSLGDIIYKPIQGTGQRQYYNHAIPLDKGIAIIKDNKVLIKKLDSKTGQEEQFILSQSEIKTLASRL